MPFRSVVTCTGLPKDGPILHPRFNTLSPSCCLHRAAQRRLCRRSGLAKGVRADDVHKNGMRHVACGKCLALFLICSVALGGSTRGRELEEPPGEVSIARFFKTYDKNPTKQSSVRESRLYPRYSTLVQLLPGTVCPKIKLFALQSWPHGPARNKIQNRTKQFCTLYV